MKATPKIRRTRRHVVIRLTPTEALAARMMMSGIARDQLPPACRKVASRVAKTLDQAVAAGRTNPPAGTRPPQNPLASED